MHLFVIALATLAAGGQAPAARATPPADWDLKPLFADGPAALRERAAIEAALPDLARWKGKLADPDMLRQALSARSALRERAQRYWMWANLRSSRDGSDEAAAADLAAAGELWARIDAATAYFEPELVALGDAGIATLTGAAELAPYRETLAQLRTRASHVLSTEQETLVAGVQPLLRRSAAVRDVLFNVELPYPSIPIAGQPRRLTFGSMRRTLQDPDRATRRAAWEAFAATQESFKLTQAGLLSSYLSGVAWEAKTRGWSSQTDMVTAGDPMPAAAFAALSAEAERAARGPLARYIALKARKLGLSEIASYDLAAPLVADTRRFTIDQAKALTLAAVAPLGREYQQRLARGMAGQWIDWQPSPAKAPSGLTGYGARDLPAYILIDYSENAAGLALYAHEWGHWLHWDYSRESGLPFEALAANVSTNDLITFVHEMLVADAEIAKATTSEARVVALTSAIEALRNSYYGVVSQAKFDLAVREAADKGAPLTAEAISALYCDARKRYAPPAVAWDARDCLGWVTEPYVYYDLYFYRYLLPTSAAAWFVERLNAGDRTVAGKLKQLLRAGGSQDGPTLLRSAGFELNDASAHAAMTRRLERLTAALEHALAAQPSQE